MPHRKNIHEPGHAHELTFSCYQRYPFLKAERCCQWLAESIEQSRKKHRFRLWSYVFMPDHVHLIVFPASDSEDTSRIRHSIKSPVGKRAIRFLADHDPQWLSRITRWRGQKKERLFWQSGGGYDRNIFTPEVLRQMIDYIHANPVRKNLVERPRDWKWSSAAWYDDRTEVPLRVDPIPKDWLE